MNLPTTDYKSSIPTWSPVENVSLQKCKPLFDNNHEAAAPINGRSYTYVYMTTNKRTSIAHQYYWKHYGAENPSKLAQ